MAETKKKLKILVVEDDAVILKTLSLVFLDAEYNILTATDGRAGWELINKTKPDLVLLDLMLPKMDGFAFLKEMKAKSDLKDIPVIVLSNLGGEEDVKRAMKLGAQDYYIKVDVNLDELLDKVEKVLGKKK